MKDAFMYEQQIKFRPGCLVHFSMEASLILEGLGNLS